MTAILDVFTLLPGAVWLVRLGCQTLRRWWSTKTCTFLSNANGCFCIGNKKNTSGKKDNWRRCRPLQLHVKNAAIFDMFDLRVTYITKQISSCYLYEDKARPASHPDPFEPQRRVDDNWMHSICWWGSCEMIKSSTAVKTFSQPASGWCSKQWTVPDCYAVH